MEGKALNIVILNGSPRKNGNTEIMAETFKKGALKNNHTVTILNIANKNIKGCQACRYCYSHSGECIINDDMKDIMENLKKADMVVFASPIYWFDITAQLKTVIDRLYACGSIGFNFNKTALLLDAGADNVFDAAIAQYKAMTSYLKWNNVGIITVPNMLEKGSINNSPKLAEIEKLGESV